MKYLGLVLGSLFVLIVSGCSGLSTAWYPMEGGKFRVMRTLSDPHLFSAAAPRSWMEVCSMKIDPPYTFDGTWIKKEWPAVSLGLGDPLFLGCVLDGAVTIHWSK
jgi:hypothetical protein